MKFVEVPFEDLPTMKEGHRGRVSYPLIKTFLETGFVCAKLDRTGMQQSMMALMSSLRAYTISHDLPIKVFQRGGELYLMRLDLNPDGSENPNWKEEMQAAKNGEALPITSEVVAARFEEEKDKVTK